MFEFRFGSFVPLAAIARDTGLLFARSPIPEAATYRFSQLTRQSSAEMTITYRPRMAWGGGNETSDVECLQSWLNLLTS